LERAVQHRGQGDAADHPPQSRLSRGESLSSLDPPGRQQQRDRSPRGRLVRRRSAGLSLFHPADAWPEQCAGQDRFPFPNPYNVFVHDTPARQLFSLESRYFSHGCMRVQDPLDIALLLLGHQDGGIWTRQRLEKIVASRNYTVVHLARPIDIHITYLTAWPRRLPARARRARRADGSRRTAALRPNFFTHRFYSGF
jgi:hypothetical protein